MGRSQGDSVVTSVKIPNLKKEWDRHGKFRVYYRRPHQKLIPLRCPIGSPEFWEDYNNARDRVETRAKQIGKEREDPNSVSALIALYFQSSEFNVLSERSKKRYRNIIEGFRNEHGHKPFKDIRRRHVKKIVGKKRDTPAAANSLLSMIKILLGFAMEYEMIEIDPTVGIKKFKERARSHHSWTEEEIEQYEAYHPIGTAARLALALMLYTGQRRGDAVRMGWQHVNGETISVCQQKTGTSLVIPIHPVLQEILSHANKDDPTFLVTKYGKPRSPDGFGNTVRKWCDEAGLPHCSSHGLRHAMGRRLAEAGCSPHQIMAITGHKSLKEVELYTKSADTMMLGAQAISMLQEANEE